MSESIRIGYAGNTEVHLKKNLQITKSIARQIATLPDSDNWYVLTKNTNTGDWLRENSFNDFKSADEYFVKLCDNNGLSKASRLQVGKGDGMGRVVQ